MMQFVKDNRFEIARARGARVHASANRADAARVGNGGRK